MLQNWTMDIRRNDTDSETNGPNGHGCGEHGPPADGHPQDDAYTCRCDPKFEGENCKTPTASEEATIVGVVLGSVAVLLLGGLAAARYQLHVAKNRPINVGAMQTELRQRLGLALPTDIGPQEFGITLALEDGDGDDELIDLDGDATYEDGVDLASELQPALPSTTFNPVFDVGSSAGSAN